MLRTALLWDITQRVVVFYRRFGTSCRFQEVKMLDLWWWDTIGCPETSVRNYGYSRNIPQERSFYLVRGGNLKSRIALCCWTAPRDRLIHRPRYRLIHTPRYRLIHRPRYRPIHTPRDRLIQTPRYRPIHRPRYRLNTRHGIGWYSRHGMWKPLTEVCSEKCETRFYQIRVCVVCVCVGRLFRVPVKCFIWNSWCWLPYRK